MSIFIKALRWFYLLYCQLMKLSYSLKRGVSIKKGVLFMGVPIITLFPESLIEIGARVVMCSNSHFADLGVCRGTILRTSRKNAKIVIGEDTGLTGAVICAAMSITIGKECLFGANVTIADNDFHPLEAHNRRYERDPEKIRCKPVVIGNNVFIGTQSIILKGVTIGDNAVIGAGSVVSCNIPANTIAAGNPARVIRALYEAGVIRAL